MYFVLRFESHKPLNSFFHSCWGKNSMLLAKMLFDCFFYRKKVFANPTLPVFSSDWFKLCFFVNVLCSVSCNLLIMIPVAMHFFD